MSKSFADVLWRRRYAVISVLVAALLLSPLFLHVIKPTYSATAHVMLVNDSANANGGLIPASDIQTLVLSQSVLQHVIKDLNLPDSPDDLRPRISAKVGLKSNIVPISYRDKNPRLALAIPNALADATVAYYHELSAGQYDLLGTALKASMRDERYHIHHLDQQLQNIVARDAFVGSEAGRGTLTQGLDTLLQARGQAYASMVADQAQSAQSQKLGDMAPVVKAQALAADPVYQNVKLGEAKDVAALSEMQAGYTDKFPALPALVDKVGRESASADRAKNTALAQGYGNSAAYAQVVTDSRHAQALVAGDKARLQAIDQQLATEQSRVTDLTKNGVFADALRLDRDSAEAAYQAMALRLSTTEANAAQASALSALVVIDRATEASPKIPQSALAFLLGLLIIGLAIGSAYALEFLDPRLRTPADIERLYGHAVIGNVGK